MAHFNLDSISAALYHQIIDRQSIPMVIKGIDKEKVLQIGDEITCNRGNYKIDKIMREYSKGVWQNESDKIQVVFVAEVSPLQNIQ